MDSLFLRGLLLAEDEVPSSGKAVYLFFEFVALGFVLEGVADIVHYGGPWYRWTASLCAAILCFWLGIKRQQIWRYIVERMPNYRALHQALSENQELRRQIDILTCPPPQQPDYLRVRYEETSNLDQRLIFSTTGPKITVKNIGLLVFEEVYRLERPLLPYKSVHPEIEPNRPSECKIFLPLYLELLANGDSITNNRLVIDYSDGSKEYSQCFRLTANEDKSIIFESAPDKTPVGDLSKLQALRRRVARTDNR